jgi:hypothetical protein
VFGTVWVRLAQLGKAGTAVVTEEVIAELEKKDDEVHGWAKKELTVVPIDGPIQVHVGHILTAHPRLVDSRKNRSKADPFVIALARIKSLSVVTGEKPSGNLNKPRIPDVCAALTPAVPCMNLLGLFRQQGWQV